MAQYRMERKERILTAIQAHFEKRPGIDPRNYGGGRDGWKAYRSESRAVTRDLHDARALLQRCALGASVTADRLMAAQRAYSGRLKLSECDDGSVSVEYCTGQYYPTEYRKAACAVLALALWDTYREESDTGDTLRRKLRNLCGYRLQTRWLD
jgi:hypothetical protein